jgi:hypothetical protein
MANLYKFDTAKTISDARYPKTMIAQLEKALADKKVPKAHIDKFAGLFKTFNLSSVVTPAQLYVQKNMVLKGAAPIQPNAVQKALLVALFGPQKLVLMAKFDLSVHLKDNKLELQHTSCKGDSKILMSVAP